MVRRQCWWRPTMINHTSPAQVCWWCLIFIIFVIWTPSTFASYHGSSPIHQHIDEDHYQCSGFTGKFCIISLIVNSCFVEHLISLLTPQFFQIPLTPRMFPVWDFVVGIFARKALLLTMDWELSTLSC